MTGPLTVLRRVRRRIVARKWRCRCGKRVFDRAALGSHPLAPTTPNSRCAWHPGIREGVLAGEIVRESQAR